MTPTPIFIDTNVQVYSAGRAHRLRGPCSDVLMLTTERPNVFFTNAEVFQELLHRYSAIRAWEPLGRESFASFAEVMEGRVEPIYAEDVEQAASLASDFPALDARDLVHAAVMKRVGATYVVSADTGFDRLPDIERLDPANVDSWRRELVEDIDQ